MDGSVWLWLIDSIDDSGMPVTTRRAPPCRVDDLDRQDASPTPSRWSGLGTLLRRGVDLFRVRRHPVLTRDAPFHRRRSPSSHDRPQRTKAA